MYSSKTGPDVKKKRLPQSGSRPIGHKMSRKSGYHGELYSLKTGQGVKKKRLPQIVVLAKCETIRQQKRLPQRVVHAQCEERRKEKDVTTELYSPNETRHQER